MYSFKKWIETLPVNQAGKDYIVGDLHGHYSILMDALESIGFNVDTDRLFCVGDLVDRGPEVGLCLSLLKEDWFYSVLGNHEYMLLTTLGHNGSMLNTIQSYLYSDRKKIKESRRHSLYLDYVDLVKDMPFSMRVESEEPFYIFHAQRPVNKSGEIWTDEKIHEKSFADISAKKVHSMLWSRKIAKEGIELNKIDKHILTPGNVSVEDIKIKGKTPFEKDVGITYCGHTILPYILFHRSHIFIDGGKYKGGQINLIDHQKIESIIKNNI